MQQIHPSSRDITIWSRIGLFIAALLATTPLTAGAQSPFGAAASKGGRSFDSALPNEAVDPLSGTLSIVETDLVLPGNAGLDVRVQRVYSSEIYPGYNSNDLTLEEDSWAGIGWKLHFGRVINPNSTTSGATKIEMGDGSRHALYTTSVSPGWTTKGFWLYDRSTHTLKLPGGLIYEFGHVVNLGGTLGTVRYVTVIRDQFNNRLEFNYFSAPGPEDGVSLIRQDLGGGQVREVTFGYDSTLKGLSSMTYDGKTWTYTQQANGPAGYSTLERVQTPVGLAVEYDYSTLGGGDPGYELKILRFPTGGTVTYVYSDVISKTGATTNKGRGVTSKTLGGTQVTPGTWTYTYSTGPNQDTTRIECPCGTTTLRFNGIGTSGNFSGWLAGTIAERTVKEGATVLETETQTWLRSEPISPDPTSGSGGLWSDAAVYAALPAVRTVTRGTRTWTTTNEYHTTDFNDYGRPWRTTEQGELYRTTTRMFQSGFTPYILPQVNHVEIGPAGYEQNFTFDAATGLLQSQTMGPYVANGPIYQY
jgi:hypothetical protein